MATITAADFRARQRFEVADTGSDYTDAQYDLLRDDALGALSQNAPADKSASLSILSGTLTYGLPADFVSLTTSRTIPSSTAVSFMPLTQYQSALIPLYRVVTAINGILIPTRDYTVYGANMTFRVDPGVTATWTLYYGGTHTLATLPDKWVDALLDYASMRIYERKMIEAANNFKYSTASTSIDKSSIIDNWKEARDARQARWDAFLISISTNSSGFGGFSSARA